MGHSFIPPDRVFAHVEKDVRKFESIIKPEDYLEIIGTHSTIVRLGSDCEVFDFNSMGTVIKDVGSWHFQLKKTKIFSAIRSAQADNVAVQGEVHFNNTQGVLKKVTRRNKKVCDMNPEVIRIRSVKVKPAKVADVKKLLSSHYGDDWEKENGLEFYVNIFSQTTNVEDDEDNDPTELLCEPRIEDNCVI